MGDYVKVVHMEDVGEDSHPYTLMSYTLGKDLKLGSHSGYAAEDEVSNLLHEHNPELLARTEWESEYGCFFAYAQSEEDAQTLKQFIDTLVEERSPGAEPGTITDSPAFFNTQE